MILEWIEWQMVVLYCKSTAANSFRGLLAGNCDAQKFKFKNATYIVLKCKASKL
jgi:hypothetical protein